MQDAIGVGLLLGMAVLFRFCFHATIALTVTRNNVIHAIPFNLITFWVLFAIAGAWSLGLGFGFIARPH